MAALKQQSPNNFSKGDLNMDVRKLKLIGLLVSGVIGLFLLVGVGRSLVGTNNAGFYQIKQAAVTGSMTVIDTPGLAPETPPAYEATLCKV